MTACFLEELEESKEAAARAQTAAVRGHTCSQAGLYAHKYIAEDAGLQAPASGRSLSRQCR